jgi:hypothetical protein
VSIIALVVALGGTAVAATKISGSSIKVRSIAGNRLKSNTLTGTQIKESTLKTVPSAFGAFAAQKATTAKTADSATTAKSADTATTANTANTAANANQLGGVGPAGYVTSSKVLRFSIAMNKGDQDRVVSGVGSVLFVASCASDGSSTAAAIKAGTNVAGVVIDGVAHGTSDTPTVVADDSTAANDTDTATVTTFDPDGSFSADGQMAASVNTSGADCRFFGHIVNDAG